MKNKQAFTLALIITTVLSMTFLTNSIYDFLTFQHIRLFLNKLIGYGIKFAEEINIDIGKYITSRMGG